MRAVGKGVSSALRIVKVPIIVDARCDRTGAAAAEQDGAPGDPGNAARRTVPCPR